MRELHDGIELQENERLGGPAVFRNWDKWVDRCEQVISWLDKEIFLDRQDRSEPWRKRGLICGVPWATFRKAVENYRIWLFDHLGGIKEVKRQLIFAHNDVRLLSPTFSLSAINANTYCRLNMATFFDSSLRNSLLYYSRLIPTNSSL